MNFLEENNDATLTEMRAHVNNVVSTTTIGRILDGQAITRKSLRPKPVGQNTPENIVKRKQFAEYYISDQKRRVHIDETNYNLFTRRNFGRAPIGMRAYKVFRNSQGRNVNILIAIDDSGVIH